MNQIPYGINHEIESSRVELPAVVRFRLEENWGVLVIWCTELCFLLELLTGVKVSIAGKVMWWTELCFFLELFISDCISGEVTCVENDSPSPSSAGASASTFRIESDNPAKGIGSSYSQSLVLVMFHFFITGVRKRGVARPKKVKDLRDLKSQLKMK